MLSPLRNRFGIPGVISVIALVFAMLGGAYAASGGLTSKQKKEVKAIAKGFQGTGPAGPAGPQGPAGANGKDGSNGSNGTNGKDGQSVTGTPIASGGACGEGVTGVKYTLGASSTNVCNGEEGEPGESPEGHPFDGAEEETRFGAGQHPCNEAGGVEYEVESVPGSQQIVCNGTDGEAGVIHPGETLPPGAIETGTWSFNGSEAEGDEILASISFPIPLAHGLIEEEDPVHFQVDETAEEFNAHCHEPGGNIGNPTALPGQLCIYVNNGAYEPINFPLQNATFAGAYNPGAELELGGGSEEQGVGRSGAILRFSYSGTGGALAHGYGAWAIGAPTE